MIWVPGSPGGRIALDVEYRVYVNGFRFASLIASPGLVRELAIGFMAASCVNPGLIHGVRRVGSSIFITLDPGSGGGRACRGGSPRQVPEARVAEAARLLASYASRVKGLGLAVHTAVLLHEDGAICIYDVSRHSAVYKALGAAALRGLRGLVVAVTGRPSGGMVRAASVTGVPVLVSTRRPLASSLLEAGVLGVRIYSTGPHGLTRYPPLTPSPEASTPSPPEDD